METELETGKQWKWKSGNVFTPCIFSSEKKLKAKLSGKHNLTITVLQILEIPNQLYELYHIQ